MTDKTENTPSLTAGSAIIQQVQETAPDSPGVYRMLDGSGQVLYVGKARSLKKRIASYTRPGRLPYRLQKMVSETVEMVLLTTGTEAEALLLENDLIKQLTPRYNILLTDDKTYPHILLTDKDAYPRLLKHRGSRKKEGTYFGPFASAGAVNRTLAILQKAFLLRSCPDHSFNNRTRPCLLHQIKRCSAPCTGEVSDEDYSALVQEAKDFLTGKSDKIFAELEEKMAKASADLAYEEAASYRDRIRALQKIRAQQTILPTRIQNADLIAIHTEKSLLCATLFFIRNGSHHGNRTLFAAYETDQPLDEVMQSFLIQFYKTADIPPMILTSHPPTEPDLVTEALTARANRKIDLSTPQRGERAALMTQVIQNAKESLLREIQTSSKQKDNLSALGRFLDIPPPERIEAFDNSHIQGSHAVGAMIVAGKSGFMKSDYRTYNIDSSELTPGDDFAMMRQVFARRYKKTEEAVLPDLILIDGGKGQLSAAYAILSDLGVADIPVLGIAKGVDRNSGREQFFIPGDSTPLDLPLNDPLRFYLQTLRDESHRFAIGTHRMKRRRAIHKSPLDSIEGIGPKRKKSLLLHFGSARAVGGATIAELTQVEGISPSMAKKIYASFHPHG